METILRVKLYSVKLYWTFIISYASSFQHIVHLTLTSQHNVSHDLTITATTHTRSPIQDHVSKPVRGGNAYATTTTLDTAGQYPGHNVSKSGTGHIIEATTSPNSKVEKLNTGANIITSVSNTAYTRNT